MRGRWGRWGRGTFCRILLALVWSRAHGPAARLEDRRDPGRGPVVRPRDRSRDAPVGPPGERASLDGDPGARFAARTGRGGRTHERFGFRALPGIPGRGPSVPPVVTEGLRREHAGPRTGSGARVGREGGGGPVDLDPPVDLAYRRRRGPSGGPGLFSAMPGPVPGGQVPRFPHPTRGIGLIGFRAE